MVGKSGKTLTIFIVLIIILLISSTCIGFYLYHLEERLHKDVEQQLDISHAVQGKLQAQLKDLQNQLSLLQDKNKEADQKINNLLDEQDLNEGLRTALKKENADLKEQIANLGQARQKMRDDLDSTSSKLAQYQELIKIAENKNQVLEARVAGLEDTNKSMEARIVELKAGRALDISNPDDRTATETSPPGHGGKGKIELDKIVVNQQNGNKGNILSIDVDAGFVICNLGLKQGVNPDNVLSVFRGDKYLGDLKVTRVQEEMSAADIIPPLSSRDLRKNDTVVLKP